MLSDNGAKEWITKNRSHLAAQDTQKIWKVGIGKGLGIVEEE